MHNHKYGTTTEFRIVIILLGDRIHAGHRNIAETQLRPTDSAVIFSLSKNVYHFNSSMTKHTEHQILY